MKTLALLAVLLAALAIAPSARAHGTRSATIDVQEASPGEAVLRVRVTQPGDAVSVRLSPPCSATSADEEANEDAAGALAVTCPGSLAGAELSVEGLGPIVTEAIVSVTFHDGTRASAVLTADEPRLRIPEHQTGLGVARAYVRRGVEHILTGYDHLLFLLSLVLLLRRARAVLWAETAFTVSHSLSFSATALGLVHVSAPAAEACIALSLVLVALDVGRSGGAPRARDGAWLAFVFGLVHGLGFAGGLSEIGLPDHDVAMALVGFAGGVEIGQVAFLAVALGAMHLVRVRGWAPRVETVAASLVGGVASYWLLERTLTCFLARV